MNKATTPDGIKVWYDRLPDGSPEISFEADVLKSAYRSNHRLYIPIDEKDNTRIDLCYWASEARNSSDIDLCDVYAFCDPSEENFEECGTGARFSYSDIPNTGREYQQNKEKEAFDYHVSSLVNNGCSTSEAYTIATSHSTGLPVSRLEVDSDFDNE